MSRKCLVQTSLINDTMSNQFTYHMVICHGNILWCMIHRPKTSENLSQMQHRPVKNASSSKERAIHYSDGIMTTMASQITSLTIVYSAVNSCADQRKHQSSASLASVRGILRWPVNSPLKGLVTRKMFPVDDVIMKSNCDFLTHPAYTRIY